MISKQLSSDQPNHHQQAAIEEHLRSLLSRMHLFWTQKQTLDGISVTAYMDEEFFLLLSKLSVPWPESIQTLVRDGLHLRMLITHYAETPRYFVLPGKAHLFALYEALDPEQVPTVDNSQWVRDFTLEEYAQTYAFTLSMMQRRLDVVHGLWVKSAIHDFGPFPWVIANPEALEMRVKQTMQEARETLEVLETAPIPPTYGTPEYEAYDMLLTTLRNASGELAQTASLLDERRKHYDQALCLTLGNRQREAHSEDQ